jgi:hypothetical protein
MNKGLSTYLHDHLAGAAGGIQLVRDLRDQHKDEPLGQFAGELLAEIEANHEILRGLAKEVSTRSHPLKEAAGWLGEQASRLKLGSHAGSLGTFEALELLSLGVLGQQALWRALAAIASGNEQLSAVDFDQLIAQTQEQHDKIEVYRIDYAKKALVEESGE